MASLLLTAFLALVGSSLAYTPRTPVRPYQNQAIVSRTAQIVRLGIDASNAGDIEQKILAKIAALRANGASDSEILESIETLSAVAPQEESEPPLPQEQSEPPPQPPQPPKPPQPLQQAPPPAPLRGDENWGSWSLAGWNVNLDVFIDDSVSSKEVRVEVAEGWLIAGVDSDRDDTPPPFLFGRFAQPVEEGELTWTIDEDSDGRRVLCIELPKKKSSPVAGVTIDCIFDESLHVNGEPCPDCPGLSKGTITIQMPDLD